MSSAILGQFSIAQVQKRP